MQLAVMEPANRGGERVAHAASECTRLGKGEVMRIRWHPAAHQAWLPQEEFSVVLVAQANRLAQSTDCTSAWLLPGDSRSLLTPNGIGQAGRPHALIRDSMRGRPARDQTTRRPSGPVTRPGRSPGVTDITESRLKPLLDHFGVCGGQRVLGRQTPLRPGSRLVRRIYGRHLPNQAFAKARR